MRARQLRTGDTGCGKVPAARPDADPDVVRRLPAGALTAAIALLVAGCSAGTAGPGSSAGSAPSATASASASQGQQNLTVPALATPSARGQLHVLSRAAFPVASSVFLGVIGAEAPDGAVFAAFGSQQGAPPVAAAGAPVYVVDGDEPVQVAEHPTIPVAALAADDSNLYVGGGDQIIEYVRATGAIARTWNLALPVRLLAVGAGRLWAVLGPASGSGRVVEIDPAGAAVTTVGTATASITSVAAGPAGIYYVEPGGATIVHVAAAGQRQQAPTHQQVNEQLSGPGAIQAISVIGVRIFLIHDAGQGLDSSSQTYDAATLAGPLTNAPGIAGSNHAVDSLAGPIDASRAGGSACSSSNCVGRYSLSTGAVTDAVTYPQGDRLDLLLGPYPAVFVLTSSGHVYLDRIG
jgi:hypothetical protein